MVIGAESLRKLKIPVYETDIDPARRYLMERNIYAQVSLTGDEIKEERSSLFVNPTMKSAEVEPEFRVLSLDIETGKDNTLYSIACHLWGNIPRKKDCIYERKEGNNRKGRSGSGFQ